MHVSRTIPCSARRTHNRLVTLCGMLLLCTTGACANSFSGSSELGEDPQVLAIRVTPPEVAPGEMVMLDALWHWPAGTPGLVWLVCIPDIADDLDTCVKNHFVPGEDVPQCGADPMAQLCVASQDSTAVFTVPYMELPEDGEKEYPVFIELVTSLEPDALNVCAEAINEAKPTDSCLLSLKEIVISGSESPNGNPVIAALVVDGETVDASDTVTVESGDSDLGELKVELAIQVDPESVDEMWPLQGDPVDAKLKVNWFTTCGTLDPAKVLFQCEPTTDGTGTGSCEPGETTWQPKVSGDCLIHAVVRDGSGGTAFLSQSFQVQ